jgi:trigger factor
MAENDTAAVAEQQEQDFEYPVKIEDAGPGAKKVSIEIPRERITAKLAEQFKDLRKQAAIPGFRPGHAPQKLVEKMFASNVRDQVRGDLIRESYEQALEKNKLQVLGEPEFDNAEEIKLPDDGPLTYSFSVEVQPEFTLPDLANLKVQKQKVDITEDNLRQAMDNLREQQGTLVPVEDRGVQAKDYLVADVHVKDGDNVVAHQHDAQVVARPGRIAGLQVDDLDKQLEGMKPGETRTITVKAPETHANEAIRGKDVQVEVALKDIKRLELAEVDQDFLQDLGFTNEADLREALRQQMVENIEYRVQQSMREQVNNYLLENVQLDLPAKMSDRQADRVVSRRAVDLMMRGMPQHQVEANLERLRGGAKEEAARELKLFFILQKIANDRNVDVSEGELNGRIAMLAAQRGRRPEKVKQEMAKDGTLANMYVQMREQKAIDQLLAGAQVEEVEVQPGQEQGSGEQAGTGEGAAQSST